MTGVPLPDRLRARADQFLEMTGGFEHTNCRDTLCIDVDCGKTQTAHTMVEAAAEIERLEGQLRVAEASKRRRLRACVEEWPECFSSGYDPRCCRFPKSCSCTVYKRSEVTEADLEPPVSSSVPVERGEERDSLDIAKEFVADALQGDGWETRDSDGQEPCWVERGTTARGNWQRFIEAPLSYLDCCKVELLLEAAATSDVSSLPGNGSEPVPVVDTSRPKEATEGPKGGSMTEDRSELRETVTLAIYANPASVIIDEAGVIGLAWEEAQKAIQSVIAAAKWDARVEQIR